MKWTDDPSHKWVAVYRVTILILTIIALYLQGTAHIERVQILEKVDPVPTIEAAIVGR